MGTEQKKDAGMMGLRIEAACIAEAADSLPLSSCSSYSSCISMPGGSLPRLEPAGRKWGGITSFPSSSQPMHGWQCCISTKPWALSRPTLRWVSPDFRTFLSRTQVNCPHDGLFITPLLVTPSLNHFTFPISLFFNISFLKIFSFLYFLFYSFFIN